MRIFIVLCFVLGAVSSLPIKREVPELSEIPEGLPEIQDDLPDLDEDGVEVDPAFPISPEAPIIAESPELSEEGIDSDLDIDPETPTLSDTIEDPSPVNTQNDSSDKNEPISPVEIPIMIEDGNVQGNNVSLRNQIRPGMQVTNYAVELEPDASAGTFRGHVAATVIISDSGTLEEDIVFHTVDLDVLSVTFSIAGGSAQTQADFNVEDDLLSIDTGVEMSMYTFFIDYTGNLDNIGSGFWVGDYQGVDYMAMNLHATNARRVFPCMDELTEASTISFTFNDLPYNNVFMNSGAEDNAPTQFRALQGPPMLWGMVAHNFNNINNPATNVQLFARQGLTSSQENQASVAINSYFNNMEEWTEKSYTDIVLDQDGRMLVIALPDVNRDWFALSTVCIWEPYVLMERIHSVKQRKEALTEMAEAIARQWYGYVIYPENWMHQWVIQGLAGYTAYELNREFQSSLIDDVTLLDYNTIFTTDVIQEALYRDSYDCAQALEPGDEIFDEDAIRDHIYNLKILKYKAPALMRMLRIILGDLDQDFIREAGRILLNSRSLETVNSRFFVDAINAEWLTSGNSIIEDVAEFLVNWIGESGYPVLHVGLRQGGVLLTQEKFSYGATSQTDFPIPITWTTSIAPNFEDDNIRPSAMMETTMTVNMALDEDDYVLFNIQGQGYYRVNYDSSLWERIIAALGDPDQREQIHPLNRATLVDDALSLARAGMLDYDLAFQLVLTMEHEIEYAPWKAFVRNMDFLRKRLIAYYLDDDENRDPDIYMRMVRRTVTRVESEIGFYPDISVTEDSMVAMTRGLVMDHACRAGYGPCIAAAVDWFWDPDNIEVVNPNIPHEIRPAVFCTMAREGGNDVIAALYARLEIEPVMYERVVIIESLACSQDSGFISTLLAETIASNSPYSVEERNRIMKAVIESSYDNVFNAINFMSLRAADIRRMYGGAEKLEDLIWHLVENLADAGQSTDFHIWVNSISSDLQDSEMTAQRARLLVEENLNWNNDHLDNVYEWIENNDATRVITSLFLIVGSFLLAIFNR